MMLAQKLARLERSMQAIGAGWRCPTCFGTGGVGWTPLITFNGERQDYRTYDENGRCRGCGAEHGKKVDIQTVPLPKA